MIKNGRFTQRQHQLPLFGALLISLLLIPAASAQSKQKAEGNFDKVITVGVKPGQMKYDKEEFSVPAGGRIKLVFDNSNGTLQHNLLILTPGDEAFAIKFAQKAWSMQNPIQNDYVPDSGDVLFATSLLSPGEKESITFTAPDKPGDHPFVCTMPGHAMSMNGTMHVTEASTSDRESDTDNTGEITSNSDGKEKTKPAKGKKKNQKNKFDKVVSVGVKPGQMKYDKEEFSVPAGGRIKLVFDNSNGTLQHNLLILTPGDEAFAIKFAQKAWSMQNPIQNDYVPDSGDVLFATSLLSPGEKESITFTAPDKPGDHPFVCTMPGHAMSMNGTMHVTKAAVKAEKKKDETKQKKKKTTKKKKKKKKEKKEENKKQAQATDGEKVKTASRKEANKEN